ncbi:MAG: cytidine deaminase, partial [Caulobacterales bacterium]|nr:cytidine deaminase [Caulobacterales bacterium]
ATAYVTLEPCARRSSGAASCAGRLADAGARRVVVACHDPHSNAGGAGLQALRDAGVAVEVGLRRSEAEALNAGFFRVVKDGRPLLAIDADAASYDADLDEAPGPDGEAVLARLAEKGVTRARLAPDAPWTPAWRATGLVDRDLAPPA